MNDIGKQQFSTNKLRNSNNIIENEELNKTIDDVFSKVVDILRDYNGPNGRLAALFDRDMTGIINTKFTRDGINIVNAIEYANPVEEHVLSMIQYIGTTIERSSGDGTTSAMILAAKLLLMLRENEYITNMPYKKFNAEWKKFQRVILKIIEDEIAIIPKEGDTELIWGLAYHQAITSSHGEEKLSKMVADLFANIPKKAWEHMIYRREAKETNEIYSIEYNTASFHTDHAALMDNRMYNNEFGNSMIHESAKLVVAPEPLASNSIYTNKIYNILNACTPGDDPIVLVINKPSADVVKKINDIYVEKRNANCEIGVVFLLDPQIPLLSESNAIYAACGYDNMHTSCDVLVIDNVKVTYSINDFRLYGLSEYDEMGYHVDLADENSAVSKFVHIADENIKLYSRKPSSSITRSTIRHIKSSRNSIMFNKIGNIVIGGTIYEGEAAMDVIEDVLKAVRESLSTGAINGGFKGLYMALEKVDTSFSDKYDNKFVENIIIILKSAITNFNINLCINSTLNKEDIINPYKSSNLVFGTSSLFNRDNIIKQNTNMVLQSAMSCKEFIKRFGDIVPKILYTNRIFIPNAVNDTIVKQ